MLKAFQGVDFTQGNWQQLWKEFWVDEKKQHMKKGDKKRNQKLAMGEEDDEVGDLFDKDDDNDNSEKEAMGKFEVTTIEAV